MLLELIALPFLVAYGAYRFVQAARTGVITGPKLGARRADQPIRFTTSMILLGGATLMAAWLLVSSVHVTFHVAG